MRTGQAPARRPALSLDGNTAVELSPGARYNTPTMLFFSLGFLALLSVIMALALQRPELLAIGGPSLVILAWGLIGGRYPQVLVKAALDTPRVLEGDQTRLSLTLVSDDDLGIVEIEMGQVPGLDSASADRLVIALRRGRPRTVTFVFVPLNWGLVDLPSFTVRARAASGLLGSTITYRPASTLRIHINEEPARTQLEPLAFRRVVGSHLSQERADGCEIADVRPYQPGDRLQAINWRISARNNEPWVTLRHPDRSTAVVLVVDAFGAFGEGSTDTLRRSVRAAMGLARLFLDTQDPVGLLVVGHGRRWIEPQLGLSHLATLTDTLLEVSSRDWADHQHRRVRPELLVPVDAEVIAISPLLNDAFGQLLQPLLARGQPVHVIEPLYELPTPDVMTVEDTDDNGSPSVALRVFSVEQQLRRRALTDIGASVSTWGPEDPIESTLMTLRRAQRARQATMRRPLR